jgi:beta-galactosidase
MTRSRLRSALLVLPLFVTPVSTRLFAAPRASTAAKPAKAQRFTVQQDHFALDGKPFKVVSGELHYARIPREYWHARLKMAKAMGLNTIATYVFWDVHEPTPGHFDFTGNNDLAAFVKAAQKEGLYVILRSGPYSCAEWDLGGFPAWLLKNPAMEKTLRSNDPSFMIPTERWIRRLAKELVPLQIGRGGPILMTQVENEYGNFDHDHVYMEHLKKIFEDSGLTASMLYSADNWRNIPGGSIPGLYAATNFGIGNHQGGMDALEKVRPGQPLFVSEYWPGWFDHWGHPHETRPVAPQLEDLDYILRRGAGINIYMFHGGTSFGFMAGSSNISGEFLPDVTSYDYDAPLDEAGHVTPKFLAYRKILATYSDCGNESCLPPVPADPPVITIPAITLGEAVPLWGNLPKPVLSAKPKPMEQLDQSYGYILYRTQLPAAVSGDLVLTELHDYAQVYLNGKLTGTLVRHSADVGTAAKPVPPTSLAIATTGPAQLDILVANDGRINSTKAMRIESKGITESVTLGGTALNGWQIYSLPMTTLPTFDARKPVTQEASGPSFRRADFTLTSLGDTFLDIRSLGKGALWINGHAIGRFWNIGPQQTLFVPGPWLRKGRNEIVVFDMLPSGTAPRVAGLSQPILDGPAADKTKSKQE